LATDTFTGPGILVRGTNLVFDVGVFSHVIYYLLDCLVDTSYERVEVLATIDAQLQKREKQFWECPGLIRRAGLVVCVEVLSIRIVHHHTGHVHPVIEDDENLLQVGFRIVSIFSWALSRMAWHFASPWKRKKIQVFMIPACTEFVIATFSRVEISGTNSCGDAVTDFVIQEKSAGSGPTLRSSGSSVQEGELFLRRGPCTI
jgi:hypothetical protein